MESNMYDRVFGYSNHELKFFFFLSLTVLELLAVSHKYPGDVFQLIFMWNISFDFYYLSGSQFAFIHVQWGPLESETLHFTTVFWILQNLWNFQDIL